MYDIFLFLNLRQKNDCAISTHSIRGPPHGSVWLVPMQARGQREKGEQRWPKLKCCFWMDPEQERAESEGARGHAHLPPHCPPVALAFQGLSLGSS